MQRQMQPPVAHTYSAEQCDIVRDWVGRSSSSALQSPGTCRHAWAALAGWLAGWLAGYSMCTRKQRTQWRRIPQAAADCFGCRWFQMFQTQLDDALRVHQRELNIARDNYSHEIKERRRSAQLSPSNRRATHACAHSGARAHRRQRTCRVRSYADASNSVPQWTSPLQAAQHRARAAWKHPRVCARTPIVRGREKPPRLPTGPLALLPSPPRSIHLK